MGSQLLDLNTEILERLVENTEASQNFIESILNDLPESAANFITDIQVGELGSSKIAGKVAEGFNNINGVTFTFTVDNQPAEMMLIIEPVTYLKWWHDKSFFCDKLFRSHGHINDGVKRYVTFIVTDCDIKASRFHSISHFNNRNGDRCESLQIHDIFVTKESGNEDSMLENWMRALVSKPEVTEESSNVSSISEAQKYRVA